MAEKSGGGILKWVLLIGCGGGLLVMLVCGGGGLLLMGTIRGSILQSAAYKEAIEIARPDAEDILGTPLEEGFFVSGSINVSGGTTDVDVSVPLKGPDGSGTLVIKARCYAGADCEYDDLTLIAGGERYDLLEYVE